MEMVILFAIVGVPLFVFGLFCAYKGTKEEHKKQQPNLPVQGH
jgi:uncharacterized membrane protein YozB (DUF420 family)